MTDLDDEIDLRPFILELSRRWWLILKIGAIAGALALAFSLLQPHKYESIATILVTRSRPTLSLAEQFPTISEPVDTTSRMSALLTMARDDAIAAETLRTIQEHLPEDYRTIEIVKRMVEVTNSGDAILIKVSANNPDLSAEIANSWAKRVVSAINQAYSGEQLPPEIERQLASVQQEYEKAQSALEIFYQTNQTTLLTKQIEELMVVMNNLNMEQSSRISYYIERQQRMEEIIIEAEALKQQLGARSGSAAASTGDALAVMLANAASFGLSRDRNNPTSILPSSASGFSIDLQLTDLTTLGEGKDSYVRDLDRLIQQAEAEQIKIETSIQDILQEVIHYPEGHAIADVSAKYQSLYTQLISQQATERELTSQRDLTWKAYQALAEKVTEIKTAAPTTAQVSLAIPAISPEKPSPRGTVRNTLVAFILGMGAATLIILAAHWWRSIDRPTSENSSITPG